MALGEGQLAVGVGRWPLFLRLQHLLEDVEELDSLLLLQLVLSIELVVIEELVTALGPGLEALVRC